MTTFAEDIEAAAGGEPIEAIVIGKTHAWGGWDNEQRPIPETAQEKPIDWATARPLLHYDYDAGFGGQDCHSVYAWTANRILFVHEYDGSTTVAWVPRSPIPCQPYADGNDEP